MHTSEERKETMSHIPDVAAIALLLMLPACSPTVTVKHQVEPIHVTVDVYLKAEQELDRFFEFEEELEEGASEATPEQGAGEEQ